MIKIVAGLGALALLAGCVVIGDRLDQAAWRFGMLPFYVFDNAKGYHQAPEPAVMDEPVNFAIAISGGGAKASVFSAGVIEQLAYLSDPRHSGRSLMDNCEAISGVSGGSYSAAYFGLFKPASLSDSNKASEFFQRYKSHMTVDYNMRGWVHYVSHPWEGVLKRYTRYRIGQSLANTFDQYVFKGATFEMLQEREVRHESPSIIINSVSLDTGRKFLFTNLNVGKNFNVNSQQLSDRASSLVGSENAKALQALAGVSGSPIFRSFGFDSIDSDISIYRLSNAIACSSAYPIIPGPMALQNYVTGGYVHLGDGGLNDNSGIDALVELYLTRLQKGHKAGRLVVVSIDVSNPMKAKKEFDPDGYVGAISYGERLANSSGQRAQTFAESLYNSQSVIKVIPIRLAESPLASKIRTSNSTYSISEKDMLTVLEAAREQFGCHAAEIEKALGGKN